uniref:Uncharacterized protein n=1 Tax=Cacopsylla melanoneura TaxID=428564 RepID=A0A8D8RMG3_9HEMI
MRPSIYFIGYHALFTLKNCVRPKDSIKKAQCVYLRIALSLLYHLYLHAFFIYLCCQLSKSIIIKQKSTTKRALSYENTPGSPLPVQLTRFNFLGAHALRSIHSLCSKPTN